MGSPAALAALLKQEAARLGFSQVGIARAGDPLPEERLLEWLGRGYHGTMEWMARSAEKRLDVKEVLPGTKSVVSVAVNYCSGLPSGGPPADEPGVGKISRYAWGDDYHAVVGDRLERLARWLTDAAPGSRAKWYVDTGPVLEKVWAERAGIGWIGKHTNVISRRYGSWIFLGEILTDLDLEYDVPHLDFCGSCTRCLEACPTGALVEPYVLDARRCVSYLTIEHRGEIPGEWRAGIGSWIYGCDICQEVCPWNREPVESGEPRFAPRPGFEAPRLAEWLEISPVELRARVKGSAMTRAKPEGLLRNLRVAAANEARPRPDGAPVPASRLLDA